MRRRSTWTLPHSVRCPHRGVVRRPPCSHTRPRSRSTSVTQMWGSSPVRHVASASAHAAARRESVNDHTAQPRQRATSSSDSGRVERPDRGGSTRSSVGSPPGQPVLLAARNSSRSDVRRRCRNRSDASLPSLRGAWRNCRVMAGVTSLSSEIPRPLTQKAANAWRMAATLARWSLEVHCSSSAVQAISTASATRRSASLPSSTSAPFPEVPARPRAAPTAPGPLHMIDNTIGP